VNAVHTVNAQINAAEAFVARTSSARAVSANAAKQETSAKVKVAINGFGRIGRMFLRCLHQRGAASNLEVVAVNDSGGVKQASHLLKYDSTMGTFNADVQIVDDTHISVDGKVITVTPPPSPGRSSAWRSSLRVPVSSSTRLVPASTSPPGPRRW
jgi:glyceraldehyde-3-phosphate dehydrogenase (NADP+) (phosphorylating)